jgi:uncharacterized protein (TIGR00730 family)
MRSHAPQNLAKDMDKPVHSICVFCGSSSGNDEIYAEAARETGRLIAARGYAMVFGGGGIGLMGETARAARDGGAKITGILPEFLRHLEPPLESGEIVEIVPDMYHRKARMIALSDAFLILPGGIGTLDEFFEVIVGKQLGQIRKPIVVMNMSGYFDPLLALLDQTAGAEFVQPTLEKLFHVVTCPEDAIARITRALDSKSALSHG